MNDAQRKRLCASIMKFCYLRPFEEVTVSDIEKQIISTAQCQKMKISILTSNGKLLTIKKRMFQCPAMTFEKQRVRVAAMYLSAGGKLNTALVFFTDLTNNGKNGVYVGKYVENLAFETDESQLLPV